MEKRTLETIWTEAELADKFGLPVSKTGKCTTVGNWSRGGLKAIRIGKRRYYCEDDVVEFLLKQREV